MRWSAALIGSTLVLSLPPAVSYQQGRPTFRSQIDVAQILVRVLDKDRRPIRGLKESDFTVIIDGAVQPVVGVVESTSEQATEPEAVWSRQFAPDVASNQVADPRLFAVILDDAGFGGILSGEPWALRETRAIFHAFLDNLGPSDLVSVVFTGDNRAPQDFTNDRTKLLETLDKFRDIAIPGGLADSDRVNTLRRSVEFLSTVPHHRSAVVMITPSMPRRSVTIKKAPLPSADGPGTTEVAEEAHLSGLVGHLLDQAMLARVPVYFISNAGMPAYKMLRSGMIVPPNHAVNDGMREIASATGGIAIAGTNAPRSEVGRIFKELQSHYLVGYTAPLPSPGVFRRVGIKVSVPGATVEPSERSYRTASTKQIAEVVRSQSSSRETTRALASVIPISDEPLHLSIAPSLHSPATGEGMVQMALGLQPRKDDAPSHFSIEARVFDAEGQKELTRQHRTVAVNQLTHDVILHPVILKPGKYQVRVSAQNHTTERAGSVYTDVVVPDYRKEPLTTSGLILSESPSIPPIKAASAAPTTKRDFPQATNVQIALSVYSGGRTPFQDALADLQVKSETGETIAKQSRRIELAGDSRLRSSQVMFSLSTRGFAVGNYLLLLSISSGRAVVTRHARFIIN
jgi:VWFA-related protein